MAGAGGLRGKSSRSLDGPHTELCVYRGQTAQGWATITTSEVCAEQSPELTRSRERVSSPQASAGSLLDGQARSRDI